VRNSAYCLSLKSFAKICFIFFFFFNKQWDAQKVPKSTLIFRYVNVFTTTLFILIFTIHNFLFCIKDTWSHWPNHFLPWITFLLWHSIQKLWNFAKQKCLCWACETHFFLQSKGVVLEHSGNPRRINIL